MEKCLNCGKEQDGFMDVIVEQEPDGTDIHAAMCPHCETIQWRDDEIGCRHPSVDWQNFCNACGRYVGDR